MKYSRLMTLLIASAVVAAILIASSPARANSAAEINGAADKALEKLYAKSADAKNLSEKAKAILVFPSITKGGFIVGGQYGEGVLLKNGKAAGYYNSVAASYGLQAGIQRYGYALFLMTDEAMKYLDKSDGWELGSTPNIVIVHAGAAGGVSTTTARSDMYAFFFSQKGLMAGLGLQGAKITKIQK